MCRLFVFPCTIDGLVLDCLCSLSVGIIFTAYALQVRFKPFLPPNNAMLGDTSVLTSGAKLIYVRMHVGHLAPTSTPIVTIS